MHRTQLIVLTIYYTYVVFVYSLVQLIYSTHSPVDVLLVEDKQNNCAFHFTVRRAIDAEYIKYGPHTWLVLVDWWLVDWWWVQGGCWLAVCGG